MMLLGNIETANLKVLEDLHRWLATIQELARQLFETPDAGVSILRRIRSETSEDLNQIQHEHSILLAARWLLQTGICRDDTEWFWNPRQTGLVEEPDLQGRDNGETIIFAEITTSAKPIGVIDARMRRTLNKLSTMAGRRYYFVCTDSMRQRANTKVSRAEWQIEVVLLPSGGDVL